MALETNAFTSYSAVGERDSIEDIIYNVSPTDVPFMSRCATTSAIQVLHEWQTDALASPSASNAQLEGDTFTAAAATATTRLSNTCQISYKVPRVTGTLRASDTIGRADELAYQVLKSSKELRTDMETSLLDNNAEVTGGATTARELGGIESWINTNTTVGSGGSAGSLGNTARTTGTDVTFTESMLKTQLANIWDAGGNPDTIYVPGTIKQLMSTFSGNASRMINAQDKELVATIDVYVSDFGDLEIIPSRHMESDSCLILQSDLWKVAYLRRPQQYEIAKTGDSDSRAILAEYTLESCNEKGSGAVFDISA